MPSVSTPDGFDIHYEVAGAGPHVLLVPGLGGDGRFWDGVVRELSDAFTLITIDHRGAGRSSRLEGEYRIDEVVADAALVLDAAGAERAHVVGHSTGGIVSQGLAIAHPGRVRSLVLSATWDRPDARFRALFEARLAVLLQAGPAVYQQLTHALGYPAAWLAAHQPDLTRAIEAASQTLAPLSVAAARLRMVMAADLSQNLPDIEAPTLVIGASDDAIVPFHHSAALARAIPGATLVTVEGGHFVPAVDPARFATILRRFLAGPS